MMIRWTGMPLLCVLCCYCCFYYADLSPTVLILFSTNVFYVYIFVIVISVVIIISVITVIAINIATNVVVINDSLLP